MTKDVYPTLLIDEGDLRKSDATNEIVTILNCGYERGRPVMRCKQNRPDDIEIHDTFGPKVICTRQEFQDKALESRCLTEVMSQTTRPIPDQLPKSYYETAEMLRNKLLKWRFENKDKVDLARSQAVDLGSHIEPRLKQTTRGFLAVFTEPEVERDLKNFLGKHQRELIEQRSETWEGMIINILYDEWKKTKETLGTGGGEVVLWAAKISGLMEGYGEKIRPGKVGRILRGMNIETKRRRIQDDGRKKRVRAIVWDSERFKTLFARYVPDYFLIEGGTDGTDGTVHEDTGGNCPKDSGTDGTDGTATGGSEFNNNNVIDTGGTVDEDTVCTVPSVPSVPTPDLLTNQIKKTLLEKDKDINEIREAVDGHTKMDIEKAIQRLKTGGKIWEPRQRGVYSLA